MTIWQGSASFSGSGSVNSTTFWVQSDNSELMSGSGALSSIAEWVGLSGPQTLIGRGAVIAAAEWVQNDFGPELFAGGGPSNPRTNLIAQSNNFSASPWVDHGITATSGNSDPFGGNTAWKILEDTSLGAEHYLSYPATLVPSTTYTYSFYINGNTLGKNYFSLRVFSNPTNTSFAWVRFSFALNNFDQDTTSGGATHSYTATSVGSGWWFITHTFNLGTSDTAADVRIEMLSGDGTSDTFIYDGGGSTGVFLCDTQLEIGSVATSYIPTTGSPLLVYGGSALVVSASKVVAGAATFAGSGSLGATSISYRGLFQGGGQLTVSALLLAGPQDIMAGSGFLAASASVLVVGNAQLLGAGDIDSTSWLLKVTTISSSTEISTPTFLEAEINEATTIAQQILTLLAGVISNSNLLAAIDNAQGNIEELLEDQGFAASLFNCFEQARIAGATYETIDNVRVFASGLSPVFPTSQWIANISVSFSLIEQAQILAVFQFTCRSQIDMYINLVAASFDSAIVASADRLDNVTYVNLIQLQGAVVNDLNTRARPLPWAVKFVLPRSFPSLWLSQRIFGDGTHNTDLINENLPIHPLFMPPVVIGFQPP